MSAAVAYEKSALNLRSVHGGYKGKCKKFMSVKTAEIEIASKNKIRGAPCVFFYDRAG